MRITNEGDQRHGYEGKWRCRKCGCAWELDKTDKEPEKMFDRDGDAFHMPCPTCKTEVYRAIPRLNGQQDR